MRWLSHFTNKGQGGFTLIELLVVIAISGLITSGLTMTIFQVFGSNARDSTKMTVVRQVENAGYWISRDTLMAQSALPAQAIIVSWDQHSEGPREDTDLLYFAFSSDDGVTWSDNIEAFHGDIGSTSQSFRYGIPEEYLATNFKMKFLFECDSTADDVYINNITISQGEFSDGCSNFIKWNSGANWTIYNGDEFQGEGSGTEADKTLTLKNSLDLSSYSGTTTGFPLTLSWSEWDGAIYQAVYTLEDMDSSHKQIKRSYSIDGGSPMEIVISRYIIPSLTNVQLVGNKIIMTVTASISGYQPQTESRTYEIQARSY